jgi:hypothetical protein
MLVAAKYEIRDATEEDVEFLATRLRKMDLKEIAAGSGRFPRAVLRSGLRTSVFCRVGLADGEPICIYGVRAASALSVEAIVWMLGTDQLHKHAMKFGRECGIQVKEMLKDFKVILNYCHAENKLTIRWLKWLGFTLNKPKPYGRKQELFHLFYLENK